RVRCFVGMRGFCYRSRFAVRGFDGGRVPAGHPLVQESGADAVIARHKVVEGELAAGPGRESYVKLSREFSELGPLVEAVKAYRATASELSDIDTLIADPATDAEMRELALAEKPAIESRRQALEQQIRLALIPKDALDE